MKGSDYIANFLADQGLKHVFVVSGGCITHSIDSVATSGRIGYIPVLHEQAGAIAADAYSRVTENLGAAFTTSGPGATNLLTGTFCSFFDSIPTIAITGQVSSKFLKRNPNLRQLGFQEADVSPIYAHATKYSALVDDSRYLRYALEKATFLARSGRPGPVLLDICEDVQFGQVDPEKMMTFIPNDSRQLNLNISNIGESIEKVYRLISEAERPVVILGAGVRYGRAIEDAKKFLKESGLPYTLTWGAMDFLPNNSPRFTGGFGVTAPRDGNFAVQNSDLIIALGTRLDTHEAGSNWSHFARGAKKVVVDLDPEELKKYEPRGMHIDLPIQANVKDVLEGLNRNLEDLRVKDLSSWLSRVQTWRERYPACIPEYMSQQGSVNPYIFMDKLSDASREGDIIIPDCGSNAIWTMQAFKTKENQRLFTSFNNSPMGYAVPASMGAAVAGKGPVTCITGDQGAMMNIQELSTIAKNNLPVKIFLMNNHGQGIIQGTLDAWLGGRYHAATPESGLPDPDYVDIAKAMGIKNTITIRDHSELGKIERILQEEGPVFCNVELRRGTQIAPKLLFGNPIEDSAPMLPDEEFYDNMIVQPLQRKGKK